MNMYTPEQIRQLRERLGMSVAEFSEKIGVTRQAVYYWESGRSHPRYKELVAINELANGKKTSTK